MKLPIFFTDFPFCCYSSRFHFTGPKIPRRFSKLLHQTSLADLTRAFNNQRFTAFVLFPL